MSWNFEKWKEDYWNCRSQLLYVGAVNSWGKKRMQFVEELLHHLPKNSEGLKKEFGSVENFVNFLCRDYDLICSLGKPLQCLMQELEADDGSQKGIREIEEVLDGYVCSLKSQ